MSKGSWRRRSSVPKKVFDDNWEKAFGKKKKSNDKKEEKEEQRQDKTK